MRDRPPDDFEAFFRTEHPRLVAIGLALTGDRDVARDLASETLARAYRSWTQLDQPEAWVRRVITNLAIDRGRRLQRERRVLTRAWHADRAEDAAPPTPVSDRFWEAVRALPARQRAAVALHYAEDRSVAEISSILDIAEGTVKATLHAARRTLAQTLAEEVAR